MDVRSNQSRDGDYFAGRCCLPRDFRSIACLDFTESDFSLRVSPALRPGRNLQTNGSPLLTQRARRVLLLPPVKSKYKSESLRGSLGRPRNQSGLERRDPAAPGVLKDHNILAALRETAYATRDGRSPDPDIASVRDLCCAVVRKNPDVYGGRR